MVDYILSIAAILFVLAIALEFVAWLIRGIQEGKWLF